MLRWKIRFTPLLVTAILVIAALANAKGGLGFISINLGW
jgi:hypothetical protein